MTKLGPEDLMIGDWVLYKGFPVRITALNAKTFNTDTFFGNTDTVGYSYEDVQPIRITPEILINNGFSEDKMYASRRVSETHYFEFYYFEHKLRLWYRGLKKNSEKVLVFLDSCLYVHELQHALKAAWNIKDFILQ